MRVLSRQAVRNALLGAGLLSFAALAASEVPAENVPVPNAAQQEEEPLPCPLGWSVESNPSVENSLSYVHESGELAVNISYIAGTAGDNVIPEAYARVAAEQMNCEIPVTSNLIDKAWSFYCPAEEIEAIVYGDEGNLVLLAISGRSDKTEPYLADFIRFLIYQAGRQ